VFLFNNLCKEIISSCIFTNCCQLWHLFFIPITCNLPERSQNVSVLKCVSFFFYQPPSCRISLPCRMGLAWLRLTNQYIINIQWLPWIPSTTKIIWPIAKKFHWFGLQQVNHNGFKVWGCVWFQVSEWKTCWYRMSQSFI
jgi:hypothetical protein